MWEILRVNQVILWEKKARNSQGIDSSLLALIILNLMQLLYARTSHALIPGLEPSASGGGVVCGTLVSCIADLIVVAVDLTPCVV